MSTFEAEGSDPIIDRVLVVSDDQKRIEETRFQLKRYIADSGRNLDIWSVNGLQAALDLMDRYINLIILNYIGFPKEKVIPVLTGLRKKYRSQILLLNDDPSIDSCQWGRVYLADHHTDSAGALASLLKRILERARHRGRTALVLAGGGILGGFNEAGSVKALHDFGIRDFDLYIGLSAGAVISSMIVNGLSPGEIIDQRHLGFLDFYHPNLKEFASKAARFIPNALKGLAEWMVMPNRDLLFILSGIATASFLSGDRIRRKVKDVFRQYGGTDDFNELRRRGKELYIVAVDLDTCEERVFGEEGEEIPISEAVAASCALPVAYHPWRIGGRDYIDGAVARTASIDVAIAHGADLIVCVNPLVPFKGGESGDMRKLGILGIVEQTYRLLIHERLQMSLNYYHHKYPHVTVVLIEPDPNDATMFHNPLNGSRSLIKLAALHGFKSTRKTIEERYDFIKRIFHYYNRPITRQVVDREFDQLVESDFAGDVIENILQHEHSFE